MFPQILLSDAVLRLLRESRSVAVAGLSPKPERPSYQVARYLQEAGYAIIPVNPSCAEVLGEIAYPDLRSVPTPIDIVDIFRRSEEVEPIVREAIAVGAKLVWMQQGVVNQAAAKLAEEAGLAVVMNRCLKIELEQLRGSLSRCSLPSSGV
ncbi:CoA-binding protein [Candidatus Electronema sp. TJ]|uniref:CoA-binding protein n=1 Tax=Candidatus Electronema sp. TJ TaxID=3401573 RepID=UPI003AA8C3BD